MSEAADLARRMHVAAVRMLKDAGHAGCDMRGTAQWLYSEHGAGQAVCGCGVFAEVTGSPESWLGSAVPAPLPVPASVGGAEQIVTPTLELVDPSAILTPDDLSAHILDVVNRLERGALFAMQCIAAEFETRRNFKMAMARHVAASKAASADRRDAEAMVACAEQFEAMTNAEMLARVARESLHNLRSILSGYQTTGRAVMAVYGAGGSPSA